MTNDRVIELTDREIEAEKAFHRALDEGHSLRKAQQMVKFMYGRSCRAIFYRYLLGGKAK